MERVIDYLYKQGRRLISPIGGPRQDIPFLCLGRIDFATALGFEAYQATPLLKAVRPIGVQNKDDLDGILNRLVYDDTAFAAEVGSLRESLKDDPALYLGGGCFGPLTAVCDILGIDSFLRYTVRQPQLVKKLLSYVQPFIADLAMREARAGAKFFWIAEPVASLLPPQDFTEFCGRYLKAIYDAAGVPGYLHVCGKTLSHMPYMAKTGAQVISIDSVTDLGASIRMVDEDVVIMGNVDVSLMKLETPQRVREETMKACGQCKNFKNFILSTGCCLIADTPQENIDAFIHAGETYPYRSNDAFRQIRHMLKLLREGKQTEFDSFIKENHIPGELVRSAVYESKYNH